MVIASILSLFRNRAPALIRCALLGLLLLPASTSAQRRVTVRATAEEDYLATRDDDQGERKPLKYVFLEGTYHPGMIRDRSLENAEIQEIARVLAPYLARKQFFPTPDAKDADIVIAIHWGMTVSLQYNKDYVHELMHQAREQQRENQDIYKSSYTDENGQPVEPSDYAQALLQESAARAAEAPDYEWARLAYTRSERDFDNRPSATLLGFNDILNRDTHRAFQSEDARTVSAMLDEERYFVVLAAYDVKNPGKDGQPHRLWVARLSTRAAGVNFNEALTTLGEVGSNYFGDHVPDLSFDKAPPRSQRAEVEVGDPIVVEDPKD